MSSSAIFEFFATFDIFEFAPSPTALSQSARPASVRQSPNERRILLCTLQLLVPSISWFFLFTTFTTQLTRQRRAPFRIYRSSALLNWRAARHD